MTIEKHNTPPDNGGRRRIDKDRREFSYTRHIPERRAGVEERRSMSDRRDSIRYE